MRKTLMATAILAALLLTGCATAEKPYDDQFCTKRNPKGQCTDWEIGPSKKQMSAFEDRSGMGYLGHPKRFISRP